MGLPDSFRAAGVIGWPVAQSRSPVLHTWWLRKYGISGVYLPMAVQPGRLEAALRGLSALRFAGCNVTIPHKEEAAHLVDHVDALARRAGAVNLVVVQPDGSLSGSNTDGYGFIQSLRHDRPEWRGDAGPASVCVGAMASARRQRGHRPAVAAEGSAAPHFGQDCAEGEDGVMPVS